MVGRYIEGTSSKYKHCAVKAKSFRNNIRINDY